MTKGASASVFAGAVASLVCAVGCGQAAQGMADANFGPADAGRTARDSAGDSSRSVAEAGSRDATDTSHADAGADASRLDAAHAFDSGAHPRDSGADAPGVTDASPHEAAVGDGSTSDPGQALGAAATPYKCAQYTCTHRLVADTDTVYVATATGIVAFPKSGGSSRVVATGTIVSDIAVDGTYVYSVDPSVGAGAYRSPKGTGGDAGTAKTFATITGLTIEGPAHLSVDSQNLYFFSEESAGIYAAPLAGGAVKEISTVNATDVALAGASLFAGEISSSSVNLLTSSGAQLGALVTSDYPYAVAGDTNNVYWGDFSIFMLTQAALAASTGAPTTLATNVAGNIGAMESDGESLYVLDMENYTSGKIVKVSISGTGDAGTSSVVFESTTGLVAGLAVDATSIYFTWAGTLYKHPK